MSPVGCQEKNFDLGNVEERCVWGGGHVDSVKIIRI